MIPRKYLFNTKETSDEKIEKQRHKAQKINLKMADIYPAYSSIIIIINGIKNFDQSLRLTE